MSAMEILRAALEREQQEPHALITVVAVSGSTPRHVGARMLISASGHSYFTIGGGRVEQVLSETAKEVAASQIPKRVKHHLVQDLGMCCGGSMEFYVEPVSPSLEAIAEAVARFDRREAFELLTDLDAGGKSIQDSTERRVAALGDGIFVEPIWPSDRLVVFGCGHVSRALGPLVRTLGFELVLCDDNQTGAVDTEPEWADRVVPSFSLRDVVAEVGPLGRGDYLIILTRDHAIDQKILEECLPQITAVDYLGLIGSLGKIGRFRKRLQAKGIWTAEEWELLHAPIGLDIAAESPAEIAVSIAAELVSIRNRRSR
jgi:xanthine dehydrogenase accessory factor